jgi:hypothetical protein
LEGKVKFGVYIFKALTLENCGGWSPLHPLPKNLYMILIINIQVESAGQELNNEQKNIKIKSFKLDKLFIHKHE